MNSDTLHICYSVNGPSVTLLTSSIYKQRKRAATHLLANIALFSKLSNFFFDLRPPGGQTSEQDKGGKTRPQGQLECANPRGSPGGDGQAWN